MNKLELIKRGKALAWSVGTMAFASGLMFLTDNLGLFGFSPTVTVALGLILNQVTKAWSNSQKQPLP